MKMMIEAIGTDVMGVCLDSGNPVWMLEDPHMTLDWRRMPAWELSRFLAVAEKGTPKLAAPRPEGRTAGQQRIEDLEVCVRYTRELLQRMKA